MPRKSIYFTDELLPRALEAAELDGRSLSAWTMLAVEAKLAATPAPSQASAGAAAYEGVTIDPATWPHAPSLGPPACLDDAGPAPTSSPDADVLRAAAALADDGPVFARYVKNAAGRQVPVSTAGEIIKAEQLEAAKRKAQS